MRTLTGKIIDIHSHAGVSVKSYARGEYPCAETVESIYYKQIANGVDVNVVFPLAPELFYDIPELLRTGKLIETKKNCGDAPYQRENEYLMKEIYEYVPELSDRFLPFVCFSPKSHLVEQLREISNLVEKYEIFGIKVLPPLCQGHIQCLREFDDLFAFAKERDIPFLFHASCAREERYSYAGDMFQLAESHPENRFCLAHCIGFHNAFLQKADAMPNVWVDTSALKIQVQLAYEDSPMLATGSDKFDADYSDHRHVVRALVQAFPDTIIWGTDSPAYSYIVDRLNANGGFSKFRLKAHYEDEKAALDFLTEELRLKIANTNSLCFLRG